MYFAGQGKEIVLKRKAFGRELERVVKCDAHVGVRVVGIDEVKATQPVDRTTKLVQQLESQGYLIEKPEAKADAAQPQKCRVLYFNEGNARRHATVFEQDGKLNLFDALQVGDVINLSGVNMGFNGIRAYDVEKIDPATQPAA